MPEEERQISQRHFLNSIGFLEQSSIPTQWRFAVTSSKSSR
jgi:hypothetical protein